MRKGDEFDNIYNHGFARLAVCVPRVHLGDTEWTVSGMIGLAGEAHRMGCAVVLFPELGVVGYSMEDLHQQDAVLRASERQIAKIAAFSSDFDPLLLVGAPFAWQGRLYNCAYAIHAGKVVGIVPKSYLPNYREFYEKRQFAAGWALPSVQEVEFMGERVPFGTGLLFRCADVAGLVVHVEICEDFWNVVPPSSFAALAGATVEANLSASNVTIGKWAARETLCASQSMRCASAYMYAAAGAGESTNDLAWDGQASIHELGVRLAESERFSEGVNLIVADVDLDRIRQERQRTGSWGDAVDAMRARMPEFRTVDWLLHVDRRKKLPLRRRIERFPFVPSDPDRLDQDCYEAYNIQVHGLEQRLRAAGIDRIVLGVSGGLDSTQALLVAARAFDRLKLPRRNLLCYTLPGYATSKSTNVNAHRLMKALGVTSEEIDITEACDLMLKRIGHPYSRGEKVYDVTFENVQAGERTSLLFRLANHHHALVLGTGDLSELALGWCTYGVGDQMSHYNPNASVAKTQIQHLIRWTAAKVDLGRGVSEVLRDILATEISPELVPPGEDGAIQSTQSIVGPYPLQDFNLFYAGRYGFAPSKIAYLSWNAWRDAEGGLWPQGIPEQDRIAYDLPAVRKWLEVFLYRFFQISQFKRTAVPNGAKTASGGSLSPRGDWRAPSDSSAADWLRELHDNVPE